MINMSIKILILLFFTLIISDTFSFTLQGGGLSPRCKLKLYNSKPPWGSFFDNLFQTTTLTKPPKVDLSIYDNDINSAKDILLEAALTKKTEPDKIVESLLSLEKLMRSKNKLDDDATSRETFKYLDGSWRLVFTTGTIDVQKKTGRVNYFPLKAVQSFDTASMAISNAIYLGDFPLIKFFGDFEWKVKARKLEFDFDQIAVLGINFNLPKGGAAKIGQGTGLGSDANNELIEKGKKPFFNWISADNEIATARGGGGGLALWRRVTEKED